MSLTQLEQRLGAYLPQSQYRDDPLGLICCQQALLALQAGDYGVGAVLVDPDGRRMVACNQVFSAGFCSRNHAEMRLLDQLESRNEPFSPYPPDDLKLVVSLEPCPMCLSRLILSGIGVVKYLAPDAQGGMVRHLNHLPPAWKNLAGLQAFYTAHVSTELRQLAADLAAFGLEERRQRLLARREP